MLKRRNDLPMLLLAQRAKAVERVIQIIQVRHLPPQGRDLLESSSHGSQTQSYALFV
jgi:hypothetical protein